MGEAELAGHMVGKKHKNLMKIKRLSPNVTRRFATCDFKDSFELYLVGFYHKYPLKPSCYYLY